jgi:hypothetical protein
MEKKECLVKPKKIIFNFLHKKAAAKHYENQCCESGYIKSDYGSESSISSESGYGSGSGYLSRSRVLMTKNKTAEKCIFLIKNCNLLIPRPP